MMLVEPLLKNKWGSVLLAGAACIALFMAIAVAAVVAPDPIGVDAGYLVIPVSLTVRETDDVSGILFDLTFDPESYELVDVFAGIAADEAGKDVQFSAQGTGAVRVLVTGFNQDTMESGAVALVYLKPLGAKQTNDTFSIENPMLSDPLGQPVKATHPRDKSLGRAGLEAELFKRLQFARTAGVFFICFFTKIFHNSFFKIVNY